MHAKNRKEAPDEPNEIFVRMIPLHEPFETPQGLGGRKPARSDDTAFEGCSIVESEPRQRAKAVSPLRSATALHDASAESKILGQSA
jgi:hypothetical protein